MTGLSTQAENLLRELVNRIDAGSVHAGRPETYPRYGEIHDALRLEMQGETVGQSLKRQGLAELAEWTLERNYPALTGLIVSNDNIMPGLGYFELFKRDENDFAWWREQIQRSLEYDWRRFLLGEPPPTPDASDLDAPPPDRVPTQVYRILRDTELARKVKMLHGYRCQVCGHTIELPDGHFYAEAHHIQPLGSPHNGPDVIGNILCVCPNHHAELDYGMTHHTQSTLRLIDGHRIDEKFLDYHNREIATARRRTADK